MLADGGQEGCQQMLTFQKQQERKKKDKKEIIAGQYCFSGKTAFLKLLYSP